MMRPRRRMYLRYNRRPYARFSYYKRYRARGKRALYLFYPRFFLSRAYRRHSYREFFINSLRKKRKMRGKTSSTFFSKIWSLTALGPLSKKEQYKLIATKMIYFPRFLRRSVKSRTFLSTMTFKYMRNIHQIMRYVCENM